MKSNKELVNFLEYYCFRKQLNNTFDVSFGSGIVIWYGQFRSRFSPYAFYALVIKTQDIGYSLMIFLTT